MKKQCLEVLAKLSEKAIKKANNTACQNWTFQPKAPQNLKEFKK